MRKIYFIRSLVCLAALCLISSASAQEAAQTKEQQLAELEKEFSYQTIREYIDYAAEDPVVRIDARKGFPNYLKYTKTEDVGTPLYKASDKVAVQDELNLVWALYNELAKQHSEAYLEKPGARELEAAARKREISRSDYMTQSGDIRKELMENTYHAETVSRMLKARSEANHNSLKIILEDYIRQGKPIPIDWIPEMTKKSLNKSARVRDVKKKIDRLNK